jgi:hypothetical protein
MSHDAAPVAQGASKRGGGTVITRRRMLAATGGLAAAAAAGRAAAQERKGTMQISRSGSQPSSKGPADYFTGTVRIDSRFQASPPARVGGGIVTFEPGARTAWHTHPLGADCHVRLRLGATGRWSQRGDPPRRRGLDPCRREALAWRYGHHGDDPHRYRGGPGRKERRLDGAGQRGTVPGRMNAPLDHVGYGLAQ